MGHGVLEESPVITGAEREGHLCPVGCFCLLLDTGVDIDSSRFGSALQTADAESHLPRAKATQDRLGHKQTNCLFLSVCLHSVIFSRGTQHACPFYLPSY